MSIRFSESIKRQIKNEIMDTVFPDYTRENLRKDIFVAFNKTVRNLYPNVPEEKIPRFYLKNRSFVIQFKNSINETFCDNSEDDFVYYISNPCLTYCRENQMIKGYIFFNRDESTFTEINKKIDAYKNFRNKCSTFCKLLDKKINEVSSEEDFRKNFPEFEHCIDKFDPTYNEDLGVCIEIDDIAV